MTEGKRTCGDSGGRKADGSPCGSKLNLSPENGQCLMHDSARTEERLRVTQAGGVASAQAKRDRKTADPDDVPSAPKTLEDAAEFASWLTHAVVVGRLDARTGHEAAYALRAFQAMAEKRDLQKEVASLRHELAAAQKRPLGVA